MQPERARLVRPAWDAYGVSRQINQQHQKAHTGARVCWLMRENLL